MIRVLHMIGSLEIGGSQAMVMNIYRNIDRSKIQFDFIVDHPENAFFSEEITQLGGKIYYFPSFKGNNYYEIKKTWNNFFKEHPEYKILHSHVRSYASLYLPIAKKYGLKTIIHSHSTSNGSGIKALVKQILQYPLRFQADYFFGCSKIAGEWLFGKKVVNSAKYYMVKNAINLNDYCSTDKREYYRKMINAKDDIVFGHVGRLHEAKNHEFLLEVFKKIHFQNPNTKLVIIGEGELRSSIEKKISSLNLSDCVYLLGAKTNVNEYMQAMDCFLFPSKWEGLPVTVVEAQASGLRCFVSNTVTKEVCISDLVTYLPIDKGIDIWVNEISKENFEKKCVTQEIINAGFSINESVNVLTSFYLNIINY